VSEPAESRLTGATVASLAREGREILERSGVAGAVPDSEILLAHALGVDRVSLHLRPARPVRPDEARVYLDLVARRADRTPLQHLTGFQEFWSLRMRVTPAVLIPRPESELLVETFLRINDRPDPLVLDIGTGSGCLAIAVASDVSRARVHAGDVSREALDVAARNAADHGLTDRIRFHHGDLFAAFRALGLEGRADFILSNPPYVAERDLPGLQPEVRDHEPRAALVAGADGLDVHRRIAAQAPAFLGRNGHLIVEFGLGQEPGLREIYGRTPLTVDGVEADLAGIPRVLVARAAAPADRPR
jgi:release factor glutamine methyltransferase